PRCTTCDQHQQNQSAQPDCDPRNGSPLGRNHWPGETLHDAALSPRGGNRVARAPARYRVTDDSNNLIPSTLSANSMETLIPTQIWEEESNRRAEETWLLLPGPAPGRRLA